MKHESIFPQGVAIGGGLSKREYFSLKIMQGLLSGVYSDKEMLDAFLTDSVNGQSKQSTGRKAFVRNALSYADALLEALDGKD